MLEAVARAERDLDILVIWQAAPFAVGASRQGHRSDQGQPVRPARKNRSQVPAGLDGAGHARRSRWWRCFGAWRWAAATRFAMHASHQVMALESYVGLVEAGVGLIPAGGGSKEFALQAWPGPARCKRCLPLHPGELQTIAMAKVARARSRRCR